MIIFASCCKGQNAFKDEAPTPKIINPEGKTQFPYDQFVDCGLQDKTGNLWFGTSRGIYCFDGKLFTNYKVINGLRVDRVSKMLEDKAGNVWFGAFGGIVCYRPSLNLKIDSGSFASIQIPVSPGPYPGNERLGNLSAPESIKAVTQIIEDSHGTIWFCAGYEVYRVDINSGKAIVTGIGQFLKSEKVKVSGGDPEDFGIVGIYEDKEGNMLFSAVACCFCFDVTYRLNAVKINNACVLNTCKHNARSQRGFEAHNKEIATSFTLITKENGGSNIAFTAVLKDRAGNIWMGSSWDSGMYIYRGAHFISVINSKELSKSVVNNIYEDKKGNIWMSTGEKNSGEGSGVFCYDGKSITQFTAKDGLCSASPFRHNFVSCIAEDDMGKLWFGGYGGLCNYDGKRFTNFTSRTGFNEQPVNCIIKTKEGNLWVGGWQLGLYRFDGKSLTCFTEMKEKL